MRRSCSILLLILIAMVRASAGSVSLVSGEEVFLFGGQPGAVPVTIRNGEPENQTADVEWRLYQASSTTIAPVGERTSLGKRELPAKQESVVQIALEPPEVRAITRFLVKVWAGGEELGQVRIMVCPSNLFSQLNGIGIDVREPVELVGTLLKGAESESDRKLSIVRLPDRATDWNRNDLAPAVLYIVGSGVQGAERLMPIKFSTDNGQRVAILQDWFVPDLEHNALSQLRLLRAIDLMIKPEQVRTPAVTN